MSAVCTCFLGHADHSEDCACTTTIMDCAVHGAGESGQWEREAVDRWYAKHVAAQEES